MTTPEGLDPSIRPGAVSGTTLLNGAPLHA